MATSRLISGDVIDTPPSFSVDKNTGDPTGYFNVSTPKALLSGPWKVLLGRTDVTSKALIAENETCTTIYLNYDYSSQDVQLMGTHVVPEYPSTIIIPLVLLLTLTLAVLTAKKKPKRARSLTEHCKSRQGHRRRSSILEPH